MTNSKPTTWINQKTGVEMRRCAVCRKPKPLMTGFSKSKGDKRARTCKACIKRRRALPEELAKRNERQRKWRKGAGRETAKAASKRYRERVKADAQRHARKCETNRMGHHLRKERNGKLTSIRQAVVTTSEGGLGGVKLPSAPIVAFIDKQAEERFLSLSVICSQLGITVKMLYEWRIDQAPVTFDVVDRIITRSNINMHDLYPPPRFPGLYSIAA